MIKKIPIKIPFTFQKHIWDRLAIGNNFETSKFIFIQFSFQNQDINNGIKSC